MNYFTYIIW